MQPWVSQQVRITQTLHDTALPDLSRPLQEGVWIYLKVIRNSLQL